MQHSLQFNTVVSINLKQYCSLRLKFCHFKWSEVAQSFPILYEPVDCSPPGSSIHGILQARILERVAISFSRGWIGCYRPSNPGGEWTHRLWADSRSYRFEREFAELGSWPQILFNREISFHLVWIIDPSSMCSSYLNIVYYLVAQSYPTLCDPMDYSLPGSSLREIPQARILEWVAISFSRGSSWPRDRTWDSCITDRFFTICTT